MKLFNRKHKGNPYEIMFEASLEWEFDKKNRADAVIFLSYDKNGNERYTAVLASSFADENSRSKQ